MKYKIAFIIAFCSTVSGAALADTAMEQAWHQLQREHAGLAAEASLVRAAESKIVVAKGNRLPAITLSSRWNYMDDNIVLPIDTGALLPGGPVIQYPVQDQTFWSTQLTATLPIYTGGKIEAGVAAQQANLAYQVAHQHSAENELFNSFVQRYLSVDLAAQNQHIRKLALDNLEKHLHRAIRMQEEGTIAYTERLQAEVERDKAEREWRNAKAQHTLAVTAYESLFTSHITLPDTAMNYRALKTLDADALTLQAIQHHPGLQQIHAKQELASAGLKAAKADFLPTIALFAKTELAKDDLTVLEPVWVAGINIEWKLYGQGNRTQNAAQFQASRDAADFTAQQAESDIRVLIQQQLTLLLNAEESYQALKTSMKLAEENLRLQQAAFEQGIRTSLDKIDAQLLLTGLQLESQKALYDYYVALANLSTITDQQALFFSVVNAM